MKSSHSLRRRGRLKSTKSDMAGPKAEDFVKSAMGAHDPPKCKRFGDDIVR
jgi:hypothetical protein